MLEVLYHRADFGRAGTSLAAVAAKNIVFVFSLFVCVYVCPSRFWTTETGRTTSAGKR